MYLTLPGFVHNYVNYIIDLSCCSAIIFLIRICYRMVSCGISMVLISGKHFICNCSNNCSVTMFWHFLFLQKVHQTKHRNIKISTTVEKFVSRTTFYTTCNRKKQYHQKNRYQKHYY